MKLLKIRFLLTVFMSMIGAKVFAYDIKVENADGVTIYYNYINDGKELEVTFRGDYSTEYSNEYQGSVVISKTVTYGGREYNVTSIGSSAFSGCSSLTSVTIGDNVTSIGKAAFSGCGRLTYVTIGNSVTSIGRAAFSSCSGLAFVTIGNSVTSIGNEAFQDCRALTSITIPNSLTTIGTGAYIQIPTSLLGTRSNTRKDAAEEGLIYNLQGQRVTNPKKGIYVRNGKKVLVN